MQEFITIPTSLISELPDDKRLALLDIFLMADENGEFYSTVRELSDRWKWGNKKTFSFLKNLEQGNILETQRKHKGDTLYRINTVFFNSQGNEKETQRKRKGNAKQSEESQKSSEFIVEIESESTNHFEIQTVLEAWNDLQNYGIKPVSKLKSGTKRHSSLLARIKEYSVVDVLSAIENIKRSDFLQGKNNRGWTITFDWFVLPNNFPKVFEGNYMNGNSQNASRKDINANKQSQLEYLLNSIMEDEMNEHNGG